MTRRRRDFGDMDFEALAERVATAVWNTTTISTGTSRSGSGTSITVSDNTQQLGDPNMFRVHDIVQEDPSITFEAFDSYQSRILQLMQRVEVLETRLAEVSQLLVEHVKRTNPPFDRKKKRCVILDQEREVDEKTVV